MAQPVVDVEPWTFETRDRAQIDRFAPVAVAKNGLSAGMVPSEFDWPAFASWQLRMAEEF